MLRRKKRIAKRVTGQFKKKPKPGVFLAVANSGQKIIRSTILTGNLQLGQLGGLEKADPRDPGAQPLRKAETAYRVVNIDRCKLPE